MRIAGYFWGVYISRMSKLLQFAELILVKLIENHTHVHVPSAATSRVQSSRKIFHFVKFAKDTSLENNLHVLYGIIVTWCAHWLYQAKDNYVCIRGIQVVFREKIRVQKQMLTP